MSIELGRVSFGLVGLGVFAICLGAAPLKAQLSSGMVNPNVDLPNEPFSYFVHPTDVVGALYDLDGG